MQQCETKNPWTQFLEFVQTRCSSAEFENWLSPISVVQTTPDETVLEVPNIFVQEYLLDNFKEVLCEFLPTRCEGEPAITFVIGSAKKQEPTPNTTFVENKLPQDTSHQTIKLNPHYTFENFIEGPSNQFVKSAAFGVAARPGKTYNPLFIHGGVGLGKTHLLHSIGHYFHGQSKKAHIHAITTEAFINDIVDNLRNKSIDKMKRFYRSLDLLLIDDIQFLQNRMNFEEEFCNTFETLIHQHKQIVITSDKPPGQLKLSERMIARMEWGLVAHMGIPDLETRVAIIKDKAEKRGLSIPSDIAFFIAEHIYNNVRQIEGAINRLFAHSKLLATKLTQDIVERILGEMLQSQPLSHNISVETILKNVATAFAIKVSDLKGQSRLKNIALARQVAMYLAKELINDSLMKIAISFGGKTHSTLLHAWKKIAEQVQMNETLHRQIQMIRRNIEQQ